MPSASDFVDAVDTFMATSKKLILPAGSKAIWQICRSDSQLRLKLPLEIEGEQRGQYLYVDAFPEHPTERFCVGIIFSHHVVCRIDFHQEARHGNPMTRRAVPAVVVGPHWHSWELNKYTFQMVGQYLKLPVAEPLKPTIRKFDAVLREFCGVRNILVADHGIELPMRRRLL